MPGLVAYSAAGLALLALAALEALPLRLPPLPRRLLPTATTPPHNAHRHLLAALLSALCLLTALLPATTSSLPTLAAAALFLLHSITPFLPLPSPPPPHLLDLLLAAAFAQELLLFAHRPATTAAGIENHYFALHLVPVTLCLAATLLAAHRPGAAPPRLARAAGLALQGTWAIQMGFSFFTSAMPTGCALHAQTHYTIKCRSHEDYHRARAVATLQFNGHLALLVLAAALAYAASISISGPNAPSTGYRMLGKEVQMEGVPSNFTLDSDDEKEDEDSTTTPATNGVHSHHQVELQVPDSK